MGWQSGDIYGNLCGYVGMYGAILGCIGFN